nr:MAG TPA: hypothetical protein [Caudoviricetes sp.]
MRLVLSTHAMHPVLLDRSPSRRVDQWRTGEHD